MALQPINYGGQIQKSLMGLGQSLAQAAQQREQREASQQQMERQKQQEEAVKSAMAQASELYRSGTPEQIAQFSLQNPDIGRNLRNQIGFRTEATRQNMLDSMKGILANPESTEKILMDRISMVNEQGGDPSQTIAELQRYREDPESFASSTEMAFALMDPAGYQAYSKAFGKQPLTDYQSEQISLRKEDQRLRQLEAQLKREDNDLKRERLLNDIENQELKIQEQRVKVESAQQARDKGVQNAQEAAMIAREILDDPALSDITGTIAPRVTTVRGESQDLINKANRLQSLLTVDNLKLMTGVLTDRDIQFLTNVASGLNITEGGILGSEKGVRRRLEEIVRKLGDVGSAKQSNAQHEREPTLDELLKKYGG